MKALKAWLCSTWMWRWLCYAQPKEETFVEEAHAAVERAEVAKRDAQRRWPLVRENAATIRRLRDANHFAELWSKGVQRP